MRNLEASVPAVIEGQYFRDLMDQPRAIDATLQWLAQDGRWAATRAFLNSRTWKRVVLTGMGSSYHGLYPLNLALIASGRTPVMMETSELVHYGMPLCGEDTLLVVVSQSGGSAEALRLLERNQRAAILAVTNTANSALTSAADHVLLTQAGVESSVSCKTYVSALIALGWLSHHFLALEESAALRAFDDVASQVEHYLRGWRNHTLELAPILKEVRHLFIAGRGNSLAAVGTGALIIKEAVRLQAEGMSSATLRHGPMEMVRPGDLTLVFCGEMPTQELNRRLTRELLDRGSSAELIGPEARLAALRLPEVESGVRPILEILPMQIVTLSSAALAGREAGVFEYASKITATE